jgi:poly(A) polymerase
MPNMQIAPDQIDPDAAKVVQRLRDNAHLAYLVGGCVRDLLLKRKPKDFDVVTSATPNEIKRLFNNCRIIGRRFRLAHIFYGPKIIETSTFRANPRELEDEDAGGDESGDLLIRRDNVFGTPEEDARRRDFTINGLFYDTKTGQVIDHVEGLVDLEARVVRTIGDPDIRFREDPIRILRAVKFAARCELTIEPETYRRMMEHRDEIRKCAQARVSEEFYRLLRAGAAKRSMELLVETDLLEIFAPEIARELRASAEDVGEDLIKRRARFWGYLAALDRSTERKPTAPSNALILAAILLPPLRESLDPSTRGVRDIGQLIAQSIAPALERLKPSRRDSELARQILLALRYLLRGANPRQRQNLRGREFYEDAVRLGEIVADAEALDPSIAVQSAAGEAAPEGAEAGQSGLEGGFEEGLPPELESLEPEGGRRRRRGRRGRLREGGREGGAPHAAAAPSGRPHHAPRETVPVDLDGLLAATRSLLATSARPAFLGSGSFGGPWSNRVE